MKRLIPLFLVICLILCSCAKINDAPSEGGKLKITATIFPLYDFARQITKDRAETVMLLPPGADSHSFDPTPSDMVNIEKSDLFFYIGGKSDEWVNTLLSSVENENLASFSLMDKVNVDSSIDDEHIWTSPKIAMEIVSVMLEKIVEADPKNADFYKENANALTAEISALDFKFEQTVSSAKHKTLVFGDRFPLAHFAACYNLKCYAAFADCGAHTEPSAKAIAELIDKIKEENLKAVFYIEFSNQKTANAIKDATGAEMLLFHACHSVTKKELASGVTYVSLMEQNLNALKIALN